MAPPPGHPGIPAQHQYYAPPPPPHGQHAPMQYQSGNPAMQHQPQHPQVQRVSESAGWNNRQYDDDSEESLDLYSHHQRSRQQQQQQQQQQGSKPNPGMSADSAIHSGSYAGTPINSTETANSTTAHSSLAEDFRRMGISPSQTMTRQQGPPSMPRKNVSTEALRKREQQLEDAYDDDDGIAGVDIDVTLFPTNPRQMAHIGRSEKYGSSADSAPHTTSSSPAGAPPSGKNLESVSTPTICSATAADVSPHTTAVTVKPASKLPLLQSHLHFAERQPVSPRASPRHVRSFANVVDDRQQQSAVQSMMHSVVRSGQKLTKSASLYKAGTTTSTRSGLQRSNQPPALAKTPSFVEPRMQRLVRRRSSRTHLRNMRAKSASISSARLLQPLAPHWSKCTKPTATNHTCQHNATNQTATPAAAPSTTTTTTTTNTVVRNPALAIAGGGNGSRPNMSRNGSPMGAQLPPSDIANGQRFYGSTGRSGSTGPPSGAHSASTTTNNSSPVYAGRPYANDNGFDSSSDRLAPGGNGGRPALRQYPPPQQQQLQQHQHQQYQHQQHQYQQDPYQQQHGAPAPFYSDPRDRNGTVRAASSPYAQPPPPPPPPHN
ncbi:hypothetical protein GGI00_004362, partial [Coemansia sp. RSA 2681]